MKSLLPSLKEKKRYLVYEVLNGNISVKELISKIQNTLGVLDSAKAGIMPVEQKSNKGIMRINNKYVDKVITAMLLIKPEIIKPIKISGILNKAREA